MFPRNRKLSKVHIESNRENGYRLLKDLHGFSAPAAPPPLAEAADIDDEEHSPGNAAAVDPFLTGSEAAAQPQDSDADDEPPAGDATDDEEAVPGDPARPTALDNIREQLQRASLEQVVPNLLLHQCLVTAEAEAYQRHAQDHDCSCPHCGACTRHLGVPAASQPVYLCTQLAIHKLQVQQVQCTSCLGTHRPTPQELGCFPGTASAFASVRGDVMPVWFSIDLLQHVDSAVFVERDQSMYKYVEVRSPGWLASQQVLGLQRAEDGRAALAELPPSFQDQQLPLSADTLRRQLGDAAREYSYVQSILDTLPEGLVGWPTGKAKPCAACDQHQLHLSFDMCFKVELLKRKGYSLDYLQPPNSRRFISNGAATEQLALIDSDLQQQQRLSQGAAAAAAAVPARVPDLPTQAVADEAPGEPAAAAPAAAAAAAPAVAPLQQPPVAVGEPGAPAAAATPPEHCGDVCSDRFAADNLAAIAPKGLLITALAVVCCRHGFIWHVVNCKDAGERHAYAVMSFLLVLMSGFMIKCWWYDINCRWMPTLLRWLQQQGDLVRQAAAGTWLPVPPWHLLAHRIQCRVKHGHVHMPGVGAGTGEVCERANAVLGPHGKITRYMRGTNREARLERVMLLMERSTDAKLPALLVELLLRARKGVQDAKERLRIAKTKLHEQLADERADPQGPALEARVQRAIEAAGRRLMEPARRLQLDWRGEYARAVLILEAAAHTVGILPAGEGLDAPASLLFTEQAVSGLAVTKRAVAAARRTAGQLGAQHFPRGAAPGLADPRVKAGVSQLVQVTISNAVEDLLILLTHARYAEYVVAELTGRAAAQRRALKRKQGLWRKAAAAHKQLLEQAQWAMQLQAEEVVDPWPADCAQQLQHLLDTPLKDVGGVSGAAGVMSGGSPADKMALEVYLLGCEIQSYEAEVDLVRRERDNLVQALQLRKSALLAALSATEAGDARQLSGRRATERFAYLLEVRRVEKTLATASALAGGMTPDEEAAQLAEAVELHAHAGEAP